MKPNNFKESAELNEWIWPSSLLLKFFSTSLQWMEAKPNPFSLCAILQLFKAVKICSSLVLLLWGTRLSPARYSFLKCTLWHIDKNLAELKAEIFLKMLHCAVSFVIEPPFVLLIFKQFNPWHAYTWKNDRFHHLCKYQKYYIPIDGNLIRNSHIQTRVLSVLFCCGMKIKRLLIKFYQLYCDRFSKPSICCSVLLWHGLVFGMP